MPVKLSSMYNPPQVIHIFTCFNNTLDSCTLYVYSIKGQLNLLVSLLYYYIFRYVPLLYSFGYSFITEKIRN